MNLQDVIRRGTRAAQPVATVVPIGTLYYVTNETLLERSTGAAWEAYSAAGPGYTDEQAQDAIGLMVDSSLVYTDATPLLVVAPFVKKRVIILIIDGNNAVITTGIKGYIRIPFGGTITKWTLLADQAGSIVVDIWKDLYANFPPTAADVITAASKPTITAAVKAEDSVLTGWTTAIASGDVLGFNVNSVATIQRVTLELEVTISS